MEKILKQILSKLDSLEQGQAATNSRLESLEQGQAATNSRLESLEQGQTELQKGLSAANSRLESLEQGQAELQEGLSAANSRLDTVEESMAKLSQSQARMENQLTEHIRGLWDFQAVQTDVNNRVLAALERIENKIEKHDIQIQVLDLTKSDKRKVK